MNRWMEKLQADLDSPISSKTSAYRVGKNKANLPALERLVAGMQKLPPEASADARDKARLNVAIEASCFVRDERFEGLKKEMPWLSCMENACLMAMRMASQMNGGQEAYKKPGDLPTPFLLEFVIFAITEEAKKLVVHPRFKRLAEEWEEETSEA